MMDNASNNKTAMTELSRILLEERKFTFDPINRRICCLPHIYNICVQHMLDTYTHADFTWCPWMWKNSVGKVIDRAEYVEMVQTNPIWLGRDVVPAVPSSGQCRSHFRQTILSGNEQERFINNTGDIVKLPVVQLLCDVKTCWDSTYYMINCLPALQQVSNPPIYYSMNIMISSSLLGRRLLLRCSPQHRYCRLQFRISAMGCFTGHGSGFRGTNSIHLANIDI